MRLLLSGHIHCGQPRHRPFTGEMDFVPLCITDAVHSNIVLAQFVDNFAHLGGLITGFLLGFVLLIHTDATGKTRPRQHCFAFLAMSALIVYVLGMIILLVLKVSALRVVCFLQVRVQPCSPFCLQINANSFCPNCHYISCVPSPWWSCDADGA